MRRSPAYIETPQIRLPPAVNISHQNIRGVHSEHTQNFIYPSLKCKWPIHTKLFAPNDLISLSYRTQYCVWNDNVYYELKKNRLKYLSATWPVLEDFLGLLKVSLSRHNNVWSRSAEFGPFLASDWSSSFDAFPNKPLMELISHSVDTFIIIPLKSRLDIGCVSLISRDFLACERWTSFCTFADRPVIGLR